MSILSSEARLPSPGEAAFRATLSRPGALRFFLLRKLPLAWLAGCRLTALEADAAAISLRHRWLNQNPFRSLYFGAQAMAAELSTGLLVMQHIWQRPGPGISMLVTAMSATFSKKATGRITFRCPDGAPIRAAVQEAGRTGAGQTFEVTSTGTDEAGTVVATFRFQWAVKRKA